MVETFRQPPLESPNICSGKYYYCIEDFITSDITSAPLMHRAWVYQELLLSARILHLGSRQVFWECKELEACETFPNGVPQQLTTRFKRTVDFEQLSDFLCELSDDEVREFMGSQYKEDAIWDIWREIRAEYNSQDLTFYSDKTNAIARLPGSGDGCYSSNCCGTAHTVERSN
jgi:hypothetical protein